MKSFTFAAAAFVMSVAGAQLLGQTVSLVADIRPGQYGSRPSALTVFNDELYFIARDELESQHLWKTDGTAISVVADIHPSIRADRLGAIFGGELYFAGYDVDRGRELWKTDGMNTVPVADINPGNRDSHPGSFTVLEGALYFWAHDGRTGRELWKHDGTNTVQLADLNPGSGSSASTPLTLFNGELYFGADDGSTGRELWKTDGRDLTQVADLNPGSADSWAGRFTELNDQLYFTGLAGSMPTLWRTDGTTVFPVGHVRGGDPDDAIELNGELYFRGKGSTGGWEVWKTDGTNTVQVTDIAPGSEDSRMGGFTALKGELFFAAENRSTGGELWKTDGVNTVQLADLNPAKGDAFSSIPGGLAFTVFDDELYFAAHDGTTGIELWKTDGTNVFQVADMNPAGDGLHAYWSEMMQFRGELYFVGDDGSTGLELWKYSPIAEPSTALLAAIAALFLLGYAWRRNRRPLAAS